MRWIYAYLATILFGPFAGVFAAEIFIKLRAQVFRFWNSDF